MSINIFKLNKHYQPVNFKAAMVQYLHILRAEEFIR